VLALILGLATPAPAQQGPDDTKLLLIHGALGKTSRLDSGGSHGYGAGLSFLTRTRILSARIHYAHEDCVLCTEHPEESVLDVALLYGLANVNPRSHVSGAVGVGYVKAVRRGAVTQPRQTLLGPQYHERLETTTVGLAAKSQLAWRPWRSLGFALHLVGNVNRSESFVGGMLGVHLAFAAPVRSEAP
jgi:hypothetical protein